MRPTNLIVSTPNGLYCPAGDFYVDPWRPVDRAIITHAHSDHARSGHGHYLAASEGAGVVRARLGDDIPLQTLPYGESIVHHGVQVSFHPAGHVLGSAQVRLAHGGEVWVVSGDYKVEPDRTCAHFEPVRCDTFITESTFGLPIYRWRPQDELFAQLNAWWRGNAEAGRTSVVFCYAFGKAQRILSGLETSIGPIVSHGAMLQLDAAYRAAGIALPMTRLATDIPRAELRRALVLAPPSAQRTPWMRRFGDYADAFASGWMQLRGARRRRGVDRGFALSDHADWPGLQQAIEASGASRVLVMHGQVAPLVRWLCERGLEASAFATEYGDESAPPEIDGPQPDNAILPAAPEA
ncbi:hypothetical protein LMG7141_01334 [Ralstonia condita]|uniref:DNA ligase-associated DEXH box helicase n=2 Tax=Ralstonia condita TaxID=3058600 RepID=A0ABM9J598_9RALS|nr:hypothetical protein LMG7141_01334 [Ralstonia sp. LMG 7141]